MFHIKKIGAFAIGLLFAVSCTKQVPKADESVSKKYCISSSLKSKIAFDTIVKKKVTDAIHLTGAVEANPDQVVHFISLVNGVISKTYFSLGDKVQKGQILAELRSTELIGMQAELKTVESQIKVSEKSLQAVQSMFNDGISSEKELLQAQSELAILKADKIKISSNLQLYSASAEKGVFQIKAPTSGIITDKTISAGTQITAEGEPLFTISNLNEVWAMVNIHASNVQNIKEGMPVNIKTLSYPGEIFNGTIKVVSQVYDNEERVLKARVVLNNVDGRLKPGMLVDVIAIELKNIEALSVPTDAIIFDNNENFVVLYNDDCDVKIVKIDVISKHEKTIYVANNFQEGQKIIAKNQLLIFEQLKNFQN
jgi:cobalt-zinc-cadmium efflux system membrane fusion protein